MKIVILDCTIGEVIVKEVPKKWHLLDGKDIISEMEYRLCDVSYMIVDNNLSININTEPLKIKTSI